MHAYFVESEIAIASGKFEQGLTLLKEAIGRANAEKTWNLAGLFQERAARALANAGRTTEANNYLTKAIGSYGRWGADAKVVHTRAKLVSEAEVDTDVIHHATSERVIHAFI